MKKFPDCSGHFAVNSELCTFPARKKLNLDHLHLDKPVLKKVYLAFFLRLWHWYESVMYIQVLAHCLRYRRGPINIWVKTNEYIALEIPLLRIFCFLCFVRTLMYLKDIKQFRLFHPNMIHLFCYFLAIVIEVKNLKLNSNVSFTSLLFS